jgi:hypothetical protein
MKNFILSYFGSGLMLLCVLTIAVVAVQAQSRYEKPESEQDFIELDAGTSISIDRERIEKLEALLIKIRTDINKSTSADIVDLNIKPVQ